MQINCPKCKKQLSISIDKLPQDKEKAMIKCPGCQQVIVFNVPKAQVPPQNIARPDKTMIDDVFGKNQKKQNKQLVDQTTGKIYFLKPGKNTIGRKADISIETDLYLSRVHCLIEIIEKTNAVEAVLSDDGSASSSGEPSKNGTFINGERLSAYDKIMLNEGDLIKIGHTELLVAIQ